MAVLLLFWIVIVNIRLSLFYGYREDAEIRVDEQ